MKGKKLITSFLFFTIIMMLIVPVIPHHHHKDGLVCMKSDTPFEKNTHYCSDCNNHCCCNTGCVATHFFQKIPAQIQALTSYTIPREIKLFTEPFLRKPILHWKTRRDETTDYLESLHSIYIVCAIGFRAPPLFS